MHPIYHRIVNRRNILLICGLAFLAFIFWYFKDIQVAYGGFVDIFSRLEEYNHFLAGAVFVIFSAISAMVSFFTSTPLIPAATHLWGREATILLLYGSWVLGGVFAYCIGYYAQTLVRHLGVYKKTQEHMNHLDAHSGFALVLLFRLALPSEVGGYTLGILRYPFWRYLLVTAISELPFAVLAVYSSNALISREPLTFILEMIGGIIFIGTMLYFFHLLLNKKYGS